MIQRENRAAGNLPEKDVSALDFANAQLEAQKDELLAMVEELSFLENRLRESEAALKNAQQIAHLGSWMLDTATGVVTLSDEMRRICGFDRGTCITTFADFLSCLHPDDAALLTKAVRKTCQSGTGYELELRVVQKDGGQRTVLSRGNIKPHKDGDNLLLVGTSLDITDRKQSEDALFHANKKLNMLSSITRHDILNNLTALYSLLDLSKEVSGKDPHLQEYFEKELGIAQTIQKQIEFTRFYQDIGVRAPEWRDVGAVIASAVSELKPKGITVNAAIPAVEIFADPLITKVFYNLMENSLRHGGNVREITFTAAEQEEGLVLVYRDDGVGITVEDKKNLFKKGFGKNTGLGLFLSREILAITTITIGENGEPGSGARFEILVPKGKYRFPVPGPAS